ncbi:MAG: V-type ATP synthase subunit F [Ruminococcaceae bacterium]|jgi:V/A-type H+-transporting ATPase subunit F|nr:V-type ATP synthase subunit F [Oscillospiraceae bacterium]
MYQVAVVGDHDSIMGYRALGMTVVAVDNAADAMPHIERLVDDHYAVIFLTEAVAEANTAYLKQLRERRLPAVIPIPSLHGSSGFGLKQVRDSVRRAVGIDLSSQAEETDQEA